MSEGLHIADAGVAAYRAAWDMQLAWHERVLSGEFAAGVLMMVEHPPVVTIGRRIGAEKHLLAPRKLLEMRGVEVVETDRGGDITFHGPGQLVVYPILNLNRYGLNLHGYMRLLEDVVIGVLGEFGITGRRDEGDKPATGVWVANPDAGLAKICAIGIKLRRWVTLHGLALNVRTDLRFFDLINPCGLSRPVTSMEKLLAARVPDMAAVKGAMAREFDCRLKPVIDRS